MTKSTSNQPAKSNVSAKTHSKLKSAKSASVQRKPPKSSHTKSSSHKQQVRRGEQGLKPAKVTDKKGLHQRNLHKDGYDFDRLIEASPELKEFVRPNPYGNLSIDFADPQAVKALNLALLKADYQITFWDIPQGFLCPPIPGRVDYIHYLADLLAGNIQQESQESSVGSQNGQNVPRVNDAFTQAVATTHKIPTGPKIKALDIGTGANGVYPILGIQAYGWQFTASDVDPLSLANVEVIISGNPSLQKKFKTRLQTDHQKVFAGIIQPEDRFDITLCNPPFHSSLAEASAGSERKLNNLAANRAAKGHEPKPAKSTVSKDKQSTKGLNFGGQKAELWCDGGEKQFLLNMIRESADFKTQCLWFTSLVSKKENLKPSYAALEKAGAVTVKTIDMAQGNKLTRVLAWSYLTPKQQALWAKYRS
ncbi:23S rRNA (adenine(1618)-N(6))-methyltransferase RlmF [Shewanella eurypsychrophilus]|uniref:Ribosomal RNA large subunit methyltransferase F n=1 Tax=Shewanella eurypsychrophilus TaxID=2593656 RepID=A0ABX6VBW3_9GAMM|nr:MULTISPECIES: 23S rRNA (adenine(1618)-N(6))-methyltransferase RlmF [Shewanella]QFU25003.1 23S rRNA (adenine(1618)-N(6))-methyltransferase RlmF [Shewanella sp. YLB-09]QPG60179.1 23S rRNA (adenine(1618)-N(6))-methyltransferase RlmF [Shewanella eurypsychrophilus]